MASKTPVQVGDIVQITGSKALRLVVRSQHIVDHDHLRGDSYSVDQFETVKFDPALTTGTLVNPKTTSYYFNTGSMSGEGKKVALSDVKVVGSAKLTAKPSIDYTFKSVKIN